MEVLKQAYDKAKDSAVLFNKIAHGKGIKDYSNKELFDAINLQVDIEVTRNLYKKMQGWVTGTNLGAIVNHKNPEKHTLRCKCGSDDIFLEDGFHYTQQNGFQLYRCGSCNGVTRINSNGSKLLGV